MSAGITSKRLEKTVLRPLDCILFLTVFVCPRSTTFESFVLCAFPPRLRANFPDQPFWLLPTCAHFCFWSLWHVCSAAALRTSLRKTTMWTTPSTGDKPSSRSVTFIVSLLLSLLFQIQKPRLVAVLLERLSHRSQPHRSVPCAVRRHHRREFHHSHRQLFVVD